VEAPPAVRAQLEDLKNGLLEALGDELVGICVHGSLALGCFSEARSDVDVIARPLVARALASYAGAGEPIEVDADERQRLLDYILERVH